MRSKSILSSVFLFTLMVVSVPKLAFGNEVWVGRGDDIGVYDFDRNYLGLFDTGPIDIAAITVVPEPSTLLLLDLGAVMARKHN